MREERREKREERREKREERFTNRQEYLYKQTNRSFPAIIFHFSPLIYKGREEELGRFLFRILERGNSKRPPEIQAGNDHRCEARMGNWKGRLKNSRLLVYFILFYLNDIKNDNHNRICILVLANRRKKTMMKLQFPIFIISRVCFSFGQRGFSLLLFFGG